MKIPFSPPYINDDVIKEVTESLTSGWITTGPKVKALEQIIKDFVGAEQVLCVNSWTSGTIMMLKWLGLKEGDEVIIPAYTYAATALAVHHAGGKVVMVDVDDDFNISVENIKAAINERTKAIIPVDIGGYPCKHDLIMDVVTDPRVKNLYKADNEIQAKIGRIMLINDAAHSLGADFSAGVKTGRETDVTIFSLHAVKNITTAEGGAICLNLPAPFDNDLLYEDLRRMSLNCQTKDAFTKTTTGGWRYDITGPGLKVNMADVNAAIGLAQMRSYPELLKERRRIFKQYNSIFEKYDWAVLPPLEENGKQSSCQLYPLRIKDIEEGERDQIIDEVFKSGVSVNVHFIPLPMLTFFKEMGYKIEEFPHSYENYKCEISLPIYPQLTVEDVDFVARSVIDAYNTIMDK